MKMLDYYQDELNIFQKELGRVLLEFPDLYSIIEHVDEYRGIFIKKMKKIDKFRREITLHERHLADEGLRENTDLWDHMELRDKFIDFGYKFDKLKTNFRRFVAKHLHAHKNT